MKHNLKIIDITPNSNLKLGKKKFDIDENRIWFSCTQFLVDGQEPTTDSLTDELKKTPVNKNNIYNNSFYVKLTKKAYNFVCKILTENQTIKVKFDVGNFIYMGIGVICNYEIKSENILLTMMNSEYTRKHKSNEDNKIRMIGFIGNGIKSLGKKLEYMEKHK